MSPMLRNLYKQISVPFALFGLRRNTSPSTTQLQVDENSIDDVECLDGYMEVFLVVPHLGRRVRGGDVRALAGKLKRFVAELDNPTVFLSKVQALDHARFLHENHGILRAFVPDYVIEGRSQELGLKKGSINHCHIHGCFTKQDERYLYLKNPDFSLPVCA